MKKLIVETEKLKHNIDIIKGMTDSTIIAVLKGNGYGLDILQYASFLIENGIDFFAVSEINEALLLRSNGFNNRILLLTSTCVEEQAELIASNNIIPTISSVTSASVMDETCKRLGMVLEVHLKIDTGFGRFGFLSDKLSEYYSFLKSLENIRITGTYSHLSFSFSKDVRFIKTQFEKFMKAVEGLRQNGVDTGILHLANSCAFLRFRELHLDAARVGSAFLGRIPIENKYDLKKIGILESKIIEFKELPEKYYIGYANTYRTRNKTRVGIIPVGYKDGFGIEKTRDTFRLRDILRYLYNDLGLLCKRLYVTVNGKKARILGRISMYNIVIDLTDIDADIGTEVFLDINPVMIDSSIKREFI